MKRFISIISASALVFTITFVGASLNSCRRKNPDVQSSSQTQTAPELNQNPTLRLKLRKNLNQSLSLSQNLNLKLKLRKNLNQNLSLSQNLNQSLSLSLKLMKKKKLMNLMHNKLYSI